MALRLIRRSPGRVKGAPDRPHDDSDAVLHRAGRHNRTRVMLALVLVVAGVALLVMERSAGPPVPTLPPAPLEGEPDIYMEAPVVSQYREDGSLEYRLVAQRASHFEGAAMTRLARPRLTLFRQARTPWTVSARDGTLRRPLPGMGEEAVALEGDVVLEQTRADGEQVRLTTESLRLYPQRQYAETDQDVMIESLFGRTMATGLEGDLQLGMLKLFSGNGRRVRTVLQPEHFK